MPHLCCSLGSPTPAMTSGCLLLGTHFSPLALGMGQELFNLAKPYFGPAFFQPHLHRTPLLSSPAFSFCLSNFSFRPTPNTEPWHDSFVENYLLPGFASLTSALEVTTSGTPFLTEVCLPLQPPAVLQSSHSCSSISSECSRSTWSRLLQTP